NGGHDCGGRRESRCGAPAGPARRRRERRGTARRPDRADVGRRRGPQRCGGRIDRVGRERQRRVQGRFHTARVCGDPRRRRADHEDVMRALVAAGADPARKAQDGTSVLMAAAAGARLTTLKYAYEIDPHVDVVTTTGNTPMHVAVALNGRTQPEVVEVIAFLADHGARLDEMNRAGRTPIAIADGLPVDLAVDLLTKLITARGEVPKIPSKR